MIKRLLFAVLFCGVQVIAVNARDLSSSEAEENTNAKAWTKAGFVGLKFTQSSFSNWASGGDDAVALDAQFTYQANYKKNAHLWQNRLELGYGINQTSNERAKKTTDKIYLNSNYGYQMHKSLYLSGFFTYQTQFAKGYNYSSNERDFVSCFMAPAYITAGLGITWVPSKIFSAVFTPVTWKGTFVLDDILAEQGAFGVKDGKKSLHECGANLKAELNCDIMKNVNLYSRLTLFTDYCRGKEVKNVDVAWDVQINMTINKWLSASITTNLIYDNDIKIPYNIKNADGEIIGEGKAAKVQFKEVLAIGLQYNF